MTASDKLSSGGAFIPALVLLLSLISAGLHLGSAQDAGDIIETITFKDPSGHEHEEYAFREPARGLPEHVLDMFCSSVRLRLYWNAYRDEIKDTARKGIYLRRMARMAKHVFEEIRDVDKPFNATMLSTVDQYMAVDLETAEDKKLDKEIAAGHQEAEGESKPAGHSLARHASLNLKDIKAKITRKLSGKDTASQANGPEADTSKAAAQSTDVAEQIDASDLMRDFDAHDQQGASGRLKAIISRMTWKNVAMGVYTRWRTMWWLMMSCLFSKYYLWDPALDEFIKLKRGLLMWPDLQLVKMHELQCKPLIFFRRLMDICKVLNPLMNFDFGQFNLEKMTRFGGN